jgi:hypothetical protein
MADLKQLKVWQKAHQVTLEIYRVTSRLPQTELYGLTSQMRLCAVSGDRISLKAEDTMGIPI